MGIISALVLMVFLHLSCNCLNFGTALDTISLSKSIKDPEAITSRGDVFTLGFFSLANSTNRYVGIWYSKSIPEESVIWVANRDKPLKDESGVVMISENGNLVVLNGQKEVLWSSNVKVPVASVSAQLLDSGNLVLQDNNSSDGVRLWESFQQPSNAFVPTMKIRTNVRTGERVQLTSWKSPSDPSNGSFSIGLGILSIAQIFIWNNTRPYWRSGPWNGQIFLGIRVQRDYSFFLDGMNLVDDKEGSFYITYAAASNKSFFSYFLLDSQGNLTRRNWNDEKRNWDIFWSPQITECDIYGKCGAFGSCNSENPSICSCLKGFQPKNKEEWNRGKWTSGCVRIKPLQCERINSGTKSGKEDGFLKLERTKVPDFPEWSANLEDKCKEQCLSNCSCIAYAYDPGIGCMSWSHNLVDIQKFRNGGIDLYVRLAHSELDENTNIRRIIIITVVTGVVAIAISTFFLWRWMAKHRAMKITSEEKLIFNNKGKAHAKCLSDDTVGENINEDKLQQQLPIFKIEELAIATKDFNLSNKLGQGGFGPVYKGTLKDGQKIAVKRLSRASGQGFEEFMNEVLLISKLQHRNLVRLLGCCIEGEEKMLVYEYMPNKSLDAFIFEKSDVFSYGVLLLEIVSGRRNTSFYNEEHPLSLVRYAWKLWNEDNILALPDKVVCDPRHYEEILRCIHVALLCVEESAKDRPTISAVLSMLHSEIVDLPSPKQPAFAERENSSDTESPQINQNIYSINDVTVTKMDGR
ncbi:S-locus glycoprotein [Corchorus olitorius]|uniref:Receptor-like serine/threonine-protein kinase n=1 Tax=Corchorus olitorius TaxID=93759 RepID=A0A1R3FZ78_9ROSI|nr:S-locus glycoprotein [Corchorus olitorius]